MEESQRSLDLSDTQPKETSPDLPVPSPQPKSALPAFICLSLLLFTVVGCLIAFSQQADSALWELQVGDIYEVHRENSLQTEGLDQGRELGAINDPTVLVSTIFILSTNRTHTELVVFMGEIDSVKSQGFFGLFSGNEEDEERGKRRGKTIPLVRVLADTKSGRICRIMAPFLADKIMIQIAESIASDLLLNRDPAVYLPMAHRQQSGGEVRDCVYPEVRGGVEVCPTFEARNTGNETVYTKVLTSAGPGRRLSSSPTSFSARQSSYINKQTGHLDHTYTIGNLTVQILNPNSQEQQNLNIRQQMTTRFSLIAKALSSSDLTLFKYLIERRLEMVDVTDLLYSRNTGRELDTKGLSSVPIFNLLGFEVRLEAELRALPYGLNVTVSLVAGNYARVTLATGVVGGSVFTAVQNVRKLSAFAGLTINETLSLLGKYSTSGVETWQNALNFANLGIWTELNKLQMTSPDYFSALNLTLASLNTTIQTLISNYTTTIREEITLYTSQLQSLNDSGVANQTAVSQLNQTLYTYLLLKDEIYCRIQDLLGKQRDSRQEESSLKGLIAGIRADILGKPAWIAYNQTIWEYMGNLTLWTNTLTTINTRLNSLKNTLLSDGNRYNDLLSIDLQALQNTVNSQLTPLNDRLAPLISQQSLLTSQYDSYNYTIQSILVALADLEESISQTTGDDQTLLIQQKTDLTEEMKANEGYMEDVKGQLEGVNGDIETVNREINTVIDVYQALGYREAEHQIERLTGEMEVISDIVQGTITTLVAAVQREGTIMRQIKNSNETLDEEKDWLGTELDQINGTLEGIGRVKSALITLESDMNMRLIEVLSLTQTYPSGYFTTANVLITALTSWKTSLFTHLSALQAILVSQLSPIQSELQTSNATSYVLYTDIPVKMASLQAVNTAQATYNLLLYQHQYDMLEIYTEITIPEQLEELYKRLNGTNELITTANTTLIEQINNKTQANPLIPQLKSQIQNVTLIFESIQNRTFNWTSIFTQYNFLNLTYLFSLQNTNETQCNLTEIQRQISLSESKITEDILKNSGNLTTQTNNFMNGFVNIENVTVTIVTGNFMNFTQISNAMANLWNLFNNTKADLWGIERELEGNVTSMERFINETRDGNGNGKDLEEIFKEIEGMGRMYNVQFLYPKNGSYGQVSKEICNQAMVVISGFSVAPLIRLYEQQFSTSLSLVSSIVLNCSLYINTYLSQYTAPLTLVTENSYYSNFALGPLCTPLGCISLAASMGIVVDSHMGVTFDNDGFYAVFSPATRCTFDGVGILTFCGSRIEVDLNAVSPIQPVYRLGSHKQALTYFVEGEVTSSFSASLQFLKTGYSKVVSTGCWCVRDGKAYRRLCLNWQTLYFQSPSLLFRLSYTSRQKTTLMTNQTLDMA